MKKIFVYLMRATLFLAYSALFVLLCFLALFFNFEKSPTFVSKVDQYLVGELNENLEKTDLALIPQDQRLSILGDVFTDEEVGGLLKKARNDFVNEGVVASPLMILESKRDVIASLMADYFFNSLDLCLDEEEDLSSFGFKCIPQNTSVDDFASIISRDLDAAVFAGSGAEYSLGSESAFKVFVGLLIGSFVLLIVICHYTLANLKR